MKRNKFIYLIIFSLVFLGFTNGVKAVNVNCCYKTADNKYVYASLPDSVCNTYTDHSTNLTQDECNKKNTNVNINETLTACDVTESECRKKLNGTYSNGCCTYASSTVVDTSSDNAANNANAKGCCMKQNNTYTFYQRNSESSCNDLANQGYGYNMGYKTKAECNAESVNSGNGNAQIITDNGNLAEDQDGNSAGNGSTSASSGSTGSETIVVGFDCNDASVASIIKTVKTIYNLLRYVTPVILIIMGSIDFLKATIAGKDDEIEKNRKKFMNRLFLAVIIFLILSIFQLTTNVLERAGVTNSNSWVECWNHINEK
nr:hypothetical protein [Bacilli bacterium]